MKKLLGQMDMVNKVRIAVAGYGLVGRRHADAIRRSPALELAGVIDPDDNNLHDAATSGAPVFDDIRSMIGHDRPDGIILATPTPMHLEHALICIEAGIPILIEKPITVSTLDAQTLVQTAQGADVPILVGHHRRHNGMVKAAKAALEAGAIGKVRAVQATCWFYKPDHYFAEAPWRTQKGAGPISVNLVHDVDLLRHLCGEVNSVTAVSVASARGFENEDLATAVLTFKSGTIATISVSDSIAAPWSWELTARENPAYPATNQSCYLIGGTKGSLSLPDLRIWEHAGNPDWWTPIGARNLLCESHEPLVAQAEHFARVIQRSEPPLVSGLEGLRSLQVVEAVARASSSGETILLNELGQEI